MIDYDQNEHVNEIENSDSNDSVLSFVLRPGRRGAVVSNEPIVNEGNIFIYYFFFKFDNFIV